MQKNKIVPIIVASIIVLAQISTFAAKGTVTTDALNVRTAPGTDANIAGKVNNGDIVNIVAKDGGWYKIDYNGSTGYASADYVSVNVLTEGVINTDLLNIRKEANTSSDIVGQFINGDTCNVTGSVGDFYEILLRGEFCYVYASYVTLRGDNVVSRSDTGYSRAGSAIVAYGEKFLGTPYVSGGSSPGGFDCSGFTSYVYKYFGISLSHSASGQVSEGVYVAKSELTPGDLVFYNTSGAGISHVAIFAGNGKILHATLPGNVLKYSDMNTAYYNSRYVTARRVIR